RTRRPSVEAAPEEPREPGERREQHALDCEGRLRRVALGLELARDQRELERARVALPVDLPVPGEADERLEQLLRSQRGAQLEERLHLLVRDREEAVRGRGGHDDRVARLEHAVLAAEVEAELAGEDLVTLGLARVQMLADEETLRSEEELVLEGLAAGLIGRPAEDDPLASGGILQDLLRARH